MSPNIGFHIYANSYNIGECLPLPRFWITIKKQIVWDCPKDFVETEGWYFFDSAQKITQLIRAYINTPESTLLTKEFDNPFHLIPILKICDHRIGERRKKALLDNPLNLETYRIIFSILK